MEGNFPATPISGGEYFAIEKPNRKLVFFLIYNKIISPGPAYKSALEDGGADIEKDHDEQRDQEEGGLPAVGVHPRHDQHCNE